MIGRWPFWWVVGIDLVASNTIMAGWPVYLSAPACGALAALVQLALNRMRRT